MEDKDINELKEELKQIRELREKKEVLAELKDEIKKEAENDKTKPKKETGFLQSMRKAAKDIQKGAQVIDKIIDPEHYKEVTNNERDD